MIEGEIGFSCQDYDEITCVAETIKFTSKNAEDGNALAQYRLGTRTKSIEWLQRAAAQNHTLALYNLSVMYAVTNQQLAFELMGKAAEINFPPALYQLAGMHYNGTGTEKNIPQEIELLQKAVARIYAPAQTQLGMRYLVGDGVEKNKEKAFYWIEKAAEQNYAPALTKLGFMYFFGMGVELNKDRAVKWFQQATEQNDAEALFQLGQIYLQKRNPAGLDLIHRSQLLGHQPAIDLWNYLIDEGVIVITIQ